MPKMAAISELFMPSYHKKVKPKKKTTSLGSVLGTSYFPPTFDRQAEAGSVHQAAKHLVQLGGLGTGEARRTRGERNRSAPISVLSPCT